MMRDSSSAPGFVAGKASRRADAPVLFLDRDGVINVNSGYVHTADRTQWVDGLPMLLQQADAKGYDIVIATNQAGIARGYYSIETFTAYTKWLHACLEEMGAAVLGTFFCPHHPTAGLGPFLTKCDCRKPEPGMLLAATNQFQINPGSAMLIGDKATDVQAGARAGIGTLVLLGEEPEGSVAPSVLRCSGLAELKL